MCTHLFGSNETWTGLMPMISLVVSCELCCFVLSSCDSDRDGVDVSKIKSLQLFENENCRCFVLYPLTFKQRLMCVVCVGSVCRMDVLYSSLFAMATWWQSVLRAFSKPCSLPLLVFLSLCTIVFLHVLASLIPFLPVFIFTFVSETLTWRTLEAHRFKFFQLSLFFCLFLSDTWWLQQPLFSLTNREITFTFMCSSSCLSLPPH